MGGPLTWTVDPSTNDTSDPAILLTEGQAPGTLNNAARGIMAGVAKMMRDQSGALTASGAAGGSLFVTTNQSFTSDDLDEPFEIAFTVDGDCPGPCELTVDGTSARQIRRADDTQPSPGDFKSGDVVRVRRKPSTNRYIIISPQIVPAGTIGYFGHPDAVPSGWLICDGSAVSRTTYVALLQKIGTTYGNGNGSTTFNVPDANGRALYAYNAQGAANPGRLRGAGGIPGSLGSSGGTDTVQLTLDHLAAHNHDGTTGSVSAHSHDYNARVAGVNVQSGAGEANIWQGVTSATTATANPHEHTIPNAGGNAAHPNMPPGLCVVIAIKG